MRLPRLEDFETTHILNSQSSLSLSFSELSRCWTLTNVVALSTTKWAHGANNEVMMPREPSHRGLHFLFHSFRMGHGDKLLSRETPGTYELIWTSFTIRLPLMSSTAMQSSQTFSQFSKTKSLWHPKCCCCCCYRVAAHIYFFFQQAFCFNIFGDLEVSNAHLESSRGSKFQTGPPLWKIGCEKNQSGQGFQTLQHILKFFPPLVKFFLLPWLQFTLSSF